MPAPTAAFTTRSTVEVTWISPRSIMRAARPTLPSMPPALPRRSGQWNLQASESADIEMSTTPTGAVDAPAGATA